MTSLHVITHFVITPCHHSIHSGEIKLDEFYQARNQLLKLEERLKVYNNMF